jgi:hypothetical protein
VKEKCCVLFRVRAVHINIMMAEPFVPEPSSSEAEVAIGKLKRYKSPGVDQIPAELIQAGGGNIAFGDS